MKNVNKKDLKKISSHYVPQGYLKSFTNAQNKLFIKNKGTGSIRQGSTKSVNYSDNFYLVDTVDEKDSQEIEETLGRVESVSLPLLSKLSDASIASDSEWADVAIYITIQYGRTPQYKRQLEGTMSIFANAHIRQTLEEASKSKRVYADLEKFNKEQAKGIKMPSQTELRAILDREISSSKISYGNNTYVRAFFEDAYTLAGYILTKQWRVMHRTDSATFLTNDSPVIPNIYTLEGKEKKVGISIMSIADRIYFPITPDECLIIFCNEPSNRAIDHYNINQNNVLKINEIVSKYAEQYVISNNENDLS